MKKILFLINNLELGGIQHSLIELLKKISSKCDVYLFCSSFKGYYSDSVPDNVTVLSENYKATVSEISLSECRKQSLRAFIRRGFYCLLTKIGLKSFAAFLYTKSVGLLPGQYDYAISYSQPVEDNDFYSLCNEVSLKCVQAKKRMTFVHCDFENYGGNTKRNRKLYCNFDYIAAVSDSVGNKIKSIIPNVEKKVVVIRNCYDEQLIKRLSLDNPIVYKTKTIISVSRLSKEKGIIRALHSFKKVIDSGLQICWLIIGDGPEYKPIETKISELNLEDYVTLVGKTGNPYRYMTNATFLLLPSYHEAAPLVFDEAFVLKVPVLTTNTLSAVEMVVNTNSGMICDNNEESIYKMMLEALRNSHCFSFEKKYESGDIAFLNLLDNEETINDE